MFNIGPKGQILLFSCYISRNLDPYMARECLQNANRFKYHTHITVGVKSLITDSGIITPPG